MKTLSIIIPAYNEEQFIGQLLERILAVDTESLGFGKEIIVVDDGSRDATGSVAAAFAGVRVLRQANAGKGSAVQHGIRQSVGDYVLVQDADLEYDPADYLPMLRALARGDVVYGSRILGVRAQQGGWTLFPGRHPQQSLGPWIMNIVLSVWAFLLYGCWLTDLLTAYKIYPAAIIKNFNVRTRGFETDHELTAKLVKARQKIVDVPIAYAPRTVAEGKKIRPIDGVIALWTLLKFRFVD
ncbi:MAG: glycosyltransferase family 2 protein [Magnetococcus sp. DMHC-1]|nr:glycosyltransferase family 2 protein [Magnetococcales bacterium]